MFLDATNRKLSIVLTGAKTTNDMPVTVDFVDMAATATTAGVQLSNTNGITSVDILAAPAVAVQRKVNGITIFNKDTAAKTVQVTLYDGATAYPLVYFTLQVNDTLGYTDTGGWYVDDQTGSRKVVFSSANYLAKSSTVYTVGPANCDYTTIQAALTANPVVNALFLVYPGTYTNDTINFTANGQCVVGMGTGEQQVITTASTTVCAGGAFTNCFLNCLTLNITAATSAVSCVTSSTGRIDADDCYFSVTNSTVTAATQPSIASVSSTGTIDFAHCDMTYTNNVSDGTGATAIKSPLLPGNGIILCSDVTLTSSGAGQSLGHTSSFTAGTGYTDITRSEVTITDTATTILAGYYLNGASIMTGLGYSKFALTGGGAASVIGIYLIGTATLTSENCSFICTGGLTNYSGNIGAGCTWNTTSDAITAASGTTGAGTINYASSPAHGQYKADLIYSTTSLMGGLSASSGNAQLQFLAGTTAKAPAQYLAGTNLTTPVAGVFPEFATDAFTGTIDTSSGRGIIPIKQNFHLTAAGGAITTIANYFGATSNISLVANAYYEIEIVCFFLKTTADTVVWTLTNSAAPTGQNIIYEMSPITGIVAPPGTATLLSGQVYNDTTAAYTFTTGTLTTGVNHYAKFKISLKNGTGTSLKIQSTATTGSLTPGIGSYWTCTRIPAGNTGTFAA